MSNYILFYGEFGQTFMEFVANSGDYCQAQHVIGRREWSLSLNRLGSSFPWPLTFTFIQLKVTTLTPDPWTFTLATGAPCMSERYYLSQYSPTPWAIRWAKHSRGPPLPNLGAQPCQESTGYRKVLFRIAAISNKTTATSSSLHMSHLPSQIPPEESAALMEWKLRPGLSSSCLTASSDALFLHVASLQLLSLFRSPSLLFAIGLFTQDWKWIYSSVHRKLFSTKYKLRNIAYFL